MKSIFFFVYLLCVYNYSSSQSLQTGRAIYAFSHIRDTLSPADIYSEEMALAFNLKQSSYFSFTKYFGDSILQARIKIVQSGGKISQEEFKAATQFRITTSESLYFNFDENKFLFLHPWIGETLGIESKIEFIDWHLQDSTKTIEGLSCNKATCNFKGRNYEVWYSPTIPVKAGPWKLNGLPGLIIEAKDQTGSIAFTLRSLTYLPNDTKQVSPTSKYRKVTKEQFDKLKNGLLQNPQAYINAAMNGTTLPNESEKAEVRRTDNKTPKTKSKLNNPIELSKD